MKRHHNHHFHGGGGAKQPGSHNGQHGEAEKIKITLQNIATTGGTNMNLVLVVFGGVPGQEERESERERG